MTDDDLSELAHSAHEEAMAFGLSHETFLRYFKTIRDRATAAERGRCMGAVPTSWLDPLLTGKDGIGAPPYHCPDIERLLSAVRVAIQAPAAGVGGKTE